MDLWAPTYKWYSRGPPGKASSQGGGTRISLISAPTDKSKIGVTEIFTAWKTAVAVNFHQLKKNKTSHPVPGSKKMIRIPMLKPGVSAYLKH